MNDLSEKEQIDELRSWWKENRAWILGGVGIGLAAIIGFRMYQSQQLDDALQASARYEALVNEVADDKLDPAIEISNLIFTENSDTVYASQARLAMARLYMDRGRDADAADVLRPLAEASGDDPLHLVARLRLARVLLYQDKPQEALDLLKKPTDTAFSARFNELIGDAHFALGNMAEAAAAYEAVLADTAAQQTVNVQFVRMKLDDLPDADEPETADVSSATTTDEATE
ncbi:MAG: tetratricopeptide repeat protein [Woeseia sp.]